MVLIIRYPRKKTSDVCCIRYKGIGQDRDSNKFLFEGLHGHLTTFNPLKGHIFLDSSWSGWVILAYSGVNR